MLPVKARDYSNNNPAVCPAALSHVLEKAIRPRSPAAIFYIAHDIDITVIWAIGTSTLACERLICKETVSAMRPNHLPGS
jgi:hypothetical protein